MNLDQAFQTFIAESMELLQEMEDRLLGIENESDRSESINSIFRAAHTIKGSAGLFGLGNVVDFTHVLESVLDKVRAEQLSLDEDLITLLLQCKDHVGKLVDGVASTDVTLTEEDGAAGRKLIAALSAYLEPESLRQTSRSAVVNVASSEEARVEATGGGVVDSDNWHISLRFGADALRNGMDPLSFIRYLGSLGTLVSITTLTDALPAPAAMDPESCYLGYEIDLESDADKQTLESAFEFVREDSQIHILPPRSKVSEYIDVIRALPEDDKRIGDLLVASGALTQRELEDGLRFQEQQAAPPRGECMPLGEILVERQAVQKEVVDSALAKQQETRERKASENKFVRVQADKLDVLINLVGELVIAGAGANILAQRQGNGAMQEATALMSRLVEEIRDGALRLRMVQIGETFSRFQRVVRDVSKELGKDIELVISGAETELDKTVVEKIGDPLTHLVRNSMDHGIESAELRTGRGKPAKGKLMLNAYHDSGSIVIEVSDDGGGLDRDKILHKAVERGIVSPNHNLSDREIYQLIFEAGFSTAEQVSNLSGRGVGMDVVRRNIEALRGTVELDSVPGEGTTVRIRLPLTLAIIDGFLVGVGSAAYVVPLDMVLECVELSDADRQSLERRAYVNLRGEVLPFVRLRDHFEVNGAASRRENIVVVNYGGHKAGLVVDNLMGEFQTVIKPLGKLFSEVKGISGSTILGTGEVALILDVPSLIQHAAAREAGLNGQAGAKATAGFSGTTERATVSIH
jgi:two-component system, chemotaxis family, sensor kinase CheA